MSLRIILCLGVLAATISGCGTNGMGNSAATSATSVAATAGSIQISNVWARPVGAVGDQPRSTTATDEAMGGRSGMATVETSAVYMTLRNTSATADRLMQANTPVAETVELHTVEQNNGVMAMRPVSGIEVPANSEVVLEPGGFHMMLIGVTQELAPGDMIDVTLQFEQAGEVAVQAEVRQP